MSCKEPYRARLLRGHFQGESGARIGTALRFRIELKCEIATKPDDNLRIQNSEINRDNRGGYELFYDNFKKQAVLEYSYH